MEKLNLIDMEKLRGLMDDKRFSHTMGVVEVAEKMSRAYQQDITKVTTAAFLHDCARGLPPEELLALAEGFGLTIDPLEQMVPDLIHGRVGAELAKKEFSVQDEEILNAIRKHTLGDESMSVLDKIIFVADMIEPGRRYPGVKDIRKLAFKDLDRAFLAGLNSTINYVINLDGIIHPKSIMARNTVLLSINPDKRRNM